MQIKALGHVVIRVSEIERSEAFYKDILGLEVCARYDQDNVKMAFFTLGNHHDFAIMQSSELGEAKHSALDHVAFNIGDHIDDLIEAKAKLERDGVTTDPVDHGVTKSIYFIDPDGNGIELYIDASNVWRDDPQQVAQSEPLAI